MNGAVLFASPQPTSRVTSSITTAPNIARLADDRRVRTLERAITKVASGTTTITGTAQPSVFAGSKVNPPGGREAEAAPEAAAARFAM